MGKQHVVRREEGWAVRGERNTRDTSRHRTQAEAIEAAKGIAQNQRTEVVIHDRGGKFRDSDSYGRDSYPPRDQRH